MNTKKKAIQEIAPIVDNVTTDSEGMLRGGFAIINSEEPGIDPLANNCFLGNCSNPSCNSVPGCGAATTTEKEGGNGASTMSLAF